MPVPHQTFVHVTTLNPGSPLPISPGKPGRVEFRVAEAPNNKSKPKLRLRLEPANEQLQIRLNGKELLTGQAVETWLEFGLGPRILRQGVNELSLNLAEKATGSASLLDLEVVVSP
jgi:hypothetical protein